MKKRHSTRLLSFLTVVSILLGMVIPVSATPLVRFELDTVVLTDGTYTSAEKPGIITSGSITVSGPKLTMDNVTLVPGQTAADSFILTTTTNRLPANTTATIELIGVNTITNPGGQASVRATGTDSTSKLVIRSAAGGTGTLDAKGVINVNDASLDIIDCTVNADGGTTLIGLAVDNGITTITNSHLAAIGSHGFVANGSLSIINSTVTCSTSEWTALYATSGLAITGSTVTADGKETGIAVQSGDMTVTDSIVNATGQFGIAIMDADLNVNSGTLTATCTSGSFAAAVCLLSNDAVEMNLNLGTGMVIKNGETMVNFAFEATTGKAIASGEVVLDNDGFTGASLHVVICPGGLSNVTIQNTSTIPSITLPAEDILNNAFLTDADRAVMANGDNVEFDVLIRTVQAPADAQKVTEVLGQKNLALYLDISITKTIGETQTEVHSSNTPITITFTIPAEFKGYDKYQIIRVHNGVTTVLEDLDTNPDTVTFSSNSFSTFALVRFNAAPPTDDPATGVPMEAASLMLSILCILAVAQRRKAHKA